MDHSAHLIAPWSWGAAFLAGLFGAGHCLGMCGGLVSAFFMRLQAKGPWPYLAYHGGRLFVYAAIGALAAGMGHALVGMGRFGLAQGLLQILAGGFVILLGFDLLGLSPIRNRLGFAPFSWLRERFLRATQRGPILGAAIGGILNGLMPCSMTMAMAVQATTAASPAGGALLLISFGMGTLPAMLSASFLFAKLSAKIRGLFLRIAAFTVILLGVSTLWQGLRYFFVMFRLAA
ncbi:MAG: sulfite exporter TauE/SafE family protein [Rhodocyclaceae bacterium]|nr:sulfite exporter TauE/SafE family protein [Rhodocyclaceae bacterium]